MKNRRDFIKLSAAGLCSLAAFPAAAAPVPGKVSPRFIFLRKSNGTAPEWLMPPSLQGKAGGDEAMEFDLDKYDLPEWMSPINSHKSDLSILQNLSAKMCTMGHSTYQSPLAVCKSAERVSTIRRASVDVILGGMLPSPFGHIEFTCAKNAKGIVRGMSSIGPQQPNFAFASPSAAFNNLFVLASSDKKSQVNNILNSHMHKFIAANIKPEGRTLKSSLETVKLGNYTSSVEDLIKRNEQLVSMTEQIKKYAPKLSKDIMSDNYTVIEQQKAFVDVILACLYARLTNVVTFSLDTLETGYSGLFDGQTIKLHEVGHNKDSKGVAAAEVRTKLRTHHMTLVNSLVEGLKKMPEGNGTMFDNTVIMYLPENGEKHHSTGTHVPFLILAGKNASLNVRGRYIQLPGYNKNGHRTLGNWYTTILNAYGNPVEHYGDFDVALKVDQKGPVKQLFI